MLTKDETIKHYMERMVGQAEECHTLVSAAIQAGYDPEQGGFAMWLCDHMYKLLESKGWKPERKISKI